MPRGGSDFVHCHCNFLAGRSFRGVTRHRGYYLQMAVCSNVTVGYYMPCYAPSHGLFAQFSLPSPSNPEPPLSLCFELRIFRHCIVEFKKGAPQRRVFTLTRVTCFILRVCVCVYVCERLRERIVQQSFYSRRFLNPNLRILLRPGRVLFIRHCKKRV